MRRQMFGSFPSRCEAEGSDCEEGAGKGRSDEHFIWSPLTLILAPKGRGKRDRQRETKWKSLRQR
jgi:hypothetical protein